MKKITLFLIFALAFVIGMPRISSARSFGGRGGFGGRGFMRGSSMHSFSMGNHSFGRGMSSTGFSRLSNANKKFVHKMG